MTCDKLSLGIDLVDEEIDALSKGKFKAIVKKSVEQFALTDLNKVKEKHSKSSYLNSSSFRTEKYLVDPSFSRLEAQMLFRLRSITLDVKMNYGSRYQDILCFKF